MGDIGDTASDISHSAIEAAGDAEGECESLSESIMVTGGRLPITSYQRVRKDVVTGPREGVLKVGDGDGQSFGSALMGQRVMEAYNQTNKAGGSLVCFGSAVSGIEMTRLEEKFLRGKLRYIKQEQETRASSRELV